MRNGKIRVLILSGRLTIEHNMVRMAYNLRTMLESTGRFEVRVTEEFSGATKRTLEGYDMVLLIYDGKDMPMDDYERLEPQAEQVLFDYVRDGGGLYIHHSACWLDEGLPEEYRQMWGYYFSVPQSRKVPKDDFAVTLAGTEPVTAGLGGELLCPGDDLFGGIVKAEGCEPEVVAYAYDDIHYYQVPGWPPAHHPVEVPDGKLENMRGVNENVPVAWKHTYGKGRVFGCSIGHDIDTFRRFGYLTMFVRACEWCAGQEVTLNKPDRSGENRLKPWPYY